MSALHLYGYRVVIEDGTYPVPNRAPTPRKWMRPAYLARLAKKWLKRFGTHPEPIVKPGEVLMMERAGIMTMNSGTFRKLKAAIAAQEAT